MNEHYRKYREADASTVLKSLVDAAVAQERERCAKVAEDVDSVGDFSLPNFLAGYRLACKSIAAVIRRGRTEDGRR